ncbi:AAA domain-containing protein [Waddlia chondrophila]|uniref:Putative DNA helicase n=1 Tax=Waddlia chondrophila (strain ATCC VR-1470 / WSU 86-1044) TaxID=716544 RepID=D6YUG8_WADCW|nr:AAA domain-containing protein [Waddlia chondrophila]ADI37779.1 putative DNA helicase [Waddlia chondrophila WSU 86-1044]
MDEKSLVLVQNSANQWEDKTEEIIEYIVDPIEGCVKILYKGNSRKYTYRQGRVRLLAATAVLNPSEVQLRVGGRLLPKADMIIKYPGFYLVKTPRSRKLYEEAKVCVERDIAVDPACKIVLDYFRSVANRIGIKGENEQSILKGQYKYLSRVPNSSVLAAYLSPGSKLKELTAPGPLIYPFGTNASQKTAVEKVFQSQVSIVQGPPGTGKTQTILNIVANAICFRQTVAIVSNNNAATKNVADKLKAKQQGFRYLRWFEVIGAEWDRAGN